MPTTSPHPLPTPAAAASSRRYVLPGPVLTDYGLWEYYPCTPKQARAWLRKAPYVSYLDTEASLALTRLVDLAVPSGRTGRVPLAADDDALVFVLADKTLGWIRRLA